MQRYIKGQGDPAVKPIALNYLMSVLVDTEEKCIGRLVGTPQATIRRAVEAKDMAALQAEHDRLLGTGNQAGVVSSKYNINYGPEGQNRAAPLALPDRPQGGASAQPGVR